MLQQLRQFFDQRLRPASADADGVSEHALHLASAALLLEMVQMDGAVREEQCTAVKNAICEHFDLDTDEAAELLELAEAERIGSTDYFQFTSLINGAYSPEQKITLVEQLWRVGYANESLHIYEEHLVRKIADLIHVPHAAFIAAKHRALDAH
jgi:uncharacterized tellurite resistance protein B-like protein